MAAATQKYGNLLRLLLLWLVVSTCIQATTTTTTTITTTPITSRRPHHQGLLLNRHLTTNDKNNQDPACWRSEVYNPNADADHKQRVVGKHGLVFYLGSKVKPIHLQTLEIAVDSNIPDFDYDWRIRIYSSNATYYDEQNFTSIQSTFVKLADTTAVLHPDGDRVVIPTTAFGETTGHGIQLGRLDRRIFYLRAAGPWLTYATNALQQAKDQGASGPRMTLFVGSPIVVEPTDTNTGDNPFALPSNDNDNDNDSKGGFDDPTQAFPTTLDTSISIVFSGRVHLQYERDVCLNRNDDNNDNAPVEPPPPLTTTTSLELVSLVNATLAAADYRRVEQAVNEKVDEWLASNSILQPYIQSFRLNMPESSKALFRPFVGQCRGWTACQFLIVKLVLEHDETLPPGMVESQFFASPSQWFEEAIRPSLPATVEAVDASYQTVQAQFQVTLHGVPSQLDSMQQDFLQHHLVRFWNARLPALYSKVFWMSVDTQLVVTNHNNNNNALQVSGVVTGGHSVLQELAEFDKGLTALFSNTANSRYLVQSLHYDSLLPGPMAQDNRADVFASLHSIQALVEGTTTLAGNGNSGNPASPNTDGSTSPSSEDSTKSGILDTFEWWMWVLCGGGLALVLLAVWLVLYCCWWNNAPGKRPSAAARGTGHAPHEQPLGGNNATKHNQSQQRLKRGLTTASSTTIPDSTPSAENNFASTLALPLPVKQREESDHALNQFVQDQQAQQSMSMVPVSAIAVTAPFGHTRPQPARNGVYDTEVPSNQPTASPPGQFSNNNRATPMNSPSPLPGVALAPGSTMTTTFGDHGLSPQGPQLQSPQGAPVRNSRPPLQQQQSIPVPPLLRQQTSSMSQGPCVQPQAPTTTQSWIVNHSPNTGNPPQQPTPSDQTTPTNTSPRKKFPTWLTTGVFGSNAPSSSSPTRPTAAVQTPSPQSPVRHNAPLPASTVMPPPPLSSSYTPRTNPMTGPQAPQSSAASSPRQQQQQQSVRNPQQPQGIRPVGAPLSTTTTPFSPTNPPPHPAVTPDSPELAAQGGGGSPRSPVSAGRRLRPLASYHLGSISAVGGQSQSPQVIPLSPQPASPRMTLTASPVPPTDKTDPSSQQRQSGTPPNTTTVPPTQLSPSRSSPPVVVGSQRRSSGVYENTLPSKPIMNIRGSMVQQARPVPQQQPPAMQHQPGQQQPSPSRSPPVVVVNQRRVSGVYETTTPSKPIMNIRGSMVQPAAPPVQSAPPVAGAPSVVVGSQRRVSGVYETTAPSKPMNIRESMVQQAAPPLQPSRATDPPPVVVGSQRRVSGVYETTTPTKSILNIRGSLVQQQQQQVAPPMQHSPAADPPPVVVRSQRQVSGVYATTTPSKPILNIRESMVPPAPPAAPEQEQPQPAPQKVAGNPSPSITVDREPRAPFKEPHSQQM